MTYYRFSVVYKVDLQMLGRFLNIKNISYRSNKEMTDEEYNNAAQWALSDKMDVKRKRISAKRRKRMKLIRESRMLRDTLQSKKKDYPTKTVNQPRLILTPMGGQTRH